LMTTWSPLVPLPHTGFQRLAELFLIRTENCRRSRKASSHLVTLTINHP
jgi:hypothetical protein